jgi:nitroimidazol reductase NimA-like FMN-containing flavoprotein (pyridoxamine 5'-phosphate oxidase superfamily)
MTLSAWGLSLHPGGRLEVLDQAECLRLLRGGRVGRLGYLASDAPRVVPVNYTVVSQSLVFRLAPESEAARSARSRPVAFEVDQLDEFLQAGWSVLAVGRATELSAEMRESLDLRSDPSPWPAGYRLLYLHLPLTQVSGRRVHPS